MKLARAVAVFVPWALLISHWGLSIKEMETFLFYGPLGKSAMYQYIGPFVLESFLFGAFCTLISMVSYVLLEKGFRHKANRIMLGVVLFMYLISATHWAFQVYCVMATELNPSSIFPIAAAPTVILSINIILGDSIVLWRMCVLWKNHRAVVLYSAVLISTMTVISALNILNAQRAAEFLISTGNFQCFSSTHSLATHANTAHAALQQKPKNADIYGEITLMLSFISNFSATLLIAFKAWSHRHRLRTHLFIGNGRTIAEKFMTLLIESGSLYSMLWALYIVSTRTKAFDTTLNFPAVTATMSADNSTVSVVPMSPSDHDTVLGSDWFNRSMAQITGIYPTIVIVLVALERSHCENQFTYKDSTPGSSHPLQVRVDHQMVVGSLRSGRHDDDLDGDLESGVKKRSESSRSELELDSVSPNYHV